MDTESIFSRWRGWGSFLPPSPHAEWAQGWALKEVARNCQQKVLSTLYPIHIHLPLAPAVLPVAPRHGLLPHLFAAWLSASLPPRFSVGSESQVDSLQAQMQQFLPLSHQAFHLAYRKINFRKMLGNETDEEIEKSGDLQDCLTLACVLWSSSDIRNYGKHLIPAVYYIIVQILITVLEG